MIKTNHSIFRIIPTFFQTYPQFLNVSSSQDLKIVMIFSHSLKFIFKIMMLDLMLLAQLIMHVILLHRYKDDITYYLALS